MVNSPAYTSLFSTRAQKEITEAWQWYEERQPRLGDRFLDAVLRRVRQIEHDPERYPTRFKSYKETIITDFPFLIIYRINKRKKSIRIVSVFHTSLNPRKKY